MENSLKLIEKIVSLWYNGLIVIMFGDGDTSETNLDN